MTWPRCSSKSISPLCSESSSMNKVLADHSPPPWVSSNLPADGRCGFLWVGIITFFGESEPYLMCQAMASMGFAYMDLPAFLAARSTLNIILSWSSPDRALGRRLALVRPHIIGGNAQRFHKTGEFPWRHGIPHILAEECWGKWSWYPSSWKSGGKPIVWPPDKNHMTLTWQRNIRTLIICNQHFPPRFAKPKSSYPKYRTWRFTPDTKLPKSLDSPMPTPFTQPIPA